MNVILIGARPSGLSIDGCTELPDVAEARFDGPTETWTVTAPDGRCVTAALVVDARQSADQTIAAHGAPNYFRIPGPALKRQIRYVAKCLQLFERTGAARMEARRPVSLRRWPRSMAAQFYLTGAAPTPDELYDGPATLGLDGHDIDTRVRLTGHLDPIDGRYHWRGTVFDDLPDSARGRAVTLTIGERTADARVVERTAWGTHTVSGVGDPPFDC